MATKVPDFAASLGHPPDSELPVKMFAERDKAELAEFDRGLIAALEAGDDSAARPSLVAGVPVDYANEDTPASELIKEYSDGRKEAVAMVHGTEVLLRRL